MMEGSKGRVLNLQECHLVSSWFIDILKKVREWWNESNLLAYHPLKNRGSLRTLTLREGLRSQDKMVCLTVSGNPDFALNKSQLQSFVKACVSAGGPVVSGALSIFLRIQQVMKGMPTQFYEMQLLGPDVIHEELYLFDKTLRFQISPSAFFQPNTRQAELLYQRAFELVKLDTSMVVWDLYCGTATLGIAAASRAKYVIGIELQPESVLDARANIELNQLKNIEIIQGDVGKTLKKLQEEESVPYPDLIMVDPPRAGLDSLALSLIKTIAPQTILYISCNPETQAANIKVLCDSGYFISALQGVDQFPHTFHVENIAVLRKKSS